MFSIVYDFLHFLHAFIIDDSFEKTFAISLDLYGIATGQVVKILNTSNKRSRHLKCQGECEPFTVLHLGFIDFAKYFIVVRFSDLKGVHERYHIKDVEFYVRISFLHFSILWQTSKRTFQNVAQFFCVKPTYPLLHEKLQQYSFYRLLNIIFQACTRFGSA